MPPPLVPTRGEPLRENHVVANGAAPKHPAPGLVGSKATKRPLTNSEPQQPRAINIQDTHKNAKLSAAGKPAAGRKTGQIVVEQRRESRNSGARAAASEEPTVLDDENEENEYTREIKASLAKINLKKRKSQAFGGQGPIKRQRIGGKQSRQEPDRQDPLARLSKSAKEVYVTATALVIEKQTGWLRWIAHATTGYPTHEAELMERLGWCEESVQEACSELCNARLMQAKLSLRGWYYTISKEELQAKPQSTAIASWNQRTVELEEHIAAMIEIDWDSDTEALTPIDAADQPLLNDGLESEDEEEQDEGEQDEGIRDVQEESEEDDSRSGSREQGDQRNHDERTAIDRVEEALRKGAARRLRLNREIPFSSNPLNSMSSRARDIYSTLLLAMNEDRCLKPVDERTITTRLPHLRQGQVYATCSQLHVNGLIVKMGRGSWLPVPLKMWHEQRVREQKEKWKGERPRRVVDRVREALGNGYHDQRRPQTRVGDVNNPLKGVGRVGRAVYGALQAAVETDPYIEAVSEEEVARTLREPIRNVHKAYLKMRALGLVIMPAIIGTDRFAKDHCWPVPLDVWREARL
ncbi:hypothetical protein LTR56_005028 [Elasticomyces elasticus]|nr:hypothetical protein LTR22_022311 [Elasticomyces elasticus]KAK3652734.1 hypothetical protein LTR56_005028 [Elasticomyces elasticus]KAK4908359.1 hypothetical protein LTR49_022717 [Elasticomyces elasticus]KAK5748399.1 hypothetical protein LTS12_021527 [Elasticomyces elasticus]